jgi:hypothetical protein
MRRILGAILAGGVSLALASPAFADPPGSVRRVGLQSSLTTTAEAREVVQSVRGVYVWSIALMCTTAPCEVAIYDSTSATSGAGTVKWEGRVSSNNGTYTQDFQAPLSLSTGLTLEVSGTGGRAFVSYEP